MAEEKTAEALKVLNPNEVSGMAELKFYKEQYKHFWVRWVFRESGNLVYQFFKEDPSVIEADLMTSKAGERVNQEFPTNFKPTMINVFKKHIPIAGKLDISYVGYMASFCVIAFGYAESLNREAVLKPLFEDLDKALESA